ncbi:MAG: hypothetical protein IJO63_01345 [Bacilli bacterium]|nr:hypothetical protein [Bacilli bacterium]
MANKTFQTKVDLYKSIIQKHLLANGVKYVAGQNEYFYFIDEIPYRLIIKDEVITIECGLTSSIEHYVFPINRADILLEHYGFTTQTGEVTEITHTKIKEEGESLNVTADAVKLYASNDREACANKIVFFSRELLGNGLFDTLVKIRSIDNSIPTGFIQDIPKATSTASAINDIAALEYELRQDLRLKQTR